MTATIQSRLAHNLGLMGMSEIKPTSSYRVFIPANNSAKYFPTKSKKILLGKSGALRGTYSGKVTESFAFPDKTKEKVLNFTESML